VSVHQLKDGRWICKFPVGTIPEQPSKTRQYFGRGQEAERAAHEFNDSLGLGKRYHAPVISPRFADLALAYLEAKVGIIAASTENRWRVRMDTTILPRLGNILAHEITPRYLDGYVAGRVKTVKRNTIHREVSDIRAILRWAVARKMLASNPMENYDMPRLDNARIKPPSRAEIEALLKHSVPHLRRVILISYFTGLRPGCAELFRLDWSAVDLIGGTITVTSAEKGGIEERTVPLTESFAATLCQWYGEDEKQGIRYLVHYNGQRVESVKHAWTNAKKRAKITRRLRLYDIRHAFATVLLERGADLKTVSEILGHRSVGITMQVYQHVSGNLKKQTVNLLDDIGNPSYQETARKPA
jgi:integrase